MFPIRPINRAHIREMQSAMLEHVLLSMLKIVTEVNYINLTLPELSEKLQGVTAETWNTELCSA